MVQREGIGRASGMLLAIAALGWAVWAGIIRTTGANEAWDHPLYFVVGVPVLMGASALATWFSRRSRYFVGLAAIVLQFAALLLGVPKGLLPLALVGGTISFGAVAIVCTLVAIITAAIWRARHEPSGVGLK